MSKKTFVSSFGDTYGSKLSKLLVYSHYRNSIGRRREPDGKHQGFRLENQF